MKKDTVLYDGKCHLCANQTKWLKRFDWLGQFEFVSLHDPQVAERWPMLSHDDLMAQIYVVDQQNLVYNGVRACRHIAERIPALYPLAVILALPGATWLAQRFYRYVAGRRYCVLQRR